MLITSDVSVIAASTVGFFLAVYFKRQLWLGAGSRATLIFSFTTASLIALVCAAAAELIGLVSMYYILVLLNRSGAAIDLVTMSQATKTVFWVTVYVATFLGACLGGTMTFFLFFPRKKERHVEYMTV